MTLGVILINGCQKETETTNLANDALVKNLSQANEIKSKDGVLVFKDKSEIEGTIQKLSVMGEEKRKEWEKRMNFKSQLTIFFEVNEAEATFQEILSKGFKKEITIEELKSMGIKPQHSDMLNKYIDKGIIRATVEDDGSLSFNLALSDRSYAYITNENGEVMIGNNVYQYWEDKVAINGKDEQNIIAKGTTYNWSASSNWRYDGNYRRYRMDITGVSSYTSSSISSNFNVEAKAERKILWSWAIRNSYDPIKSINGYYNYEYWYVQYPGGPMIRSTNNLPLPSPPQPLTSPFSMDYSYFGGSNYTLIPLHPSGIFNFTYPSTASFIDAVNVCQKQIVCKIYDKPDIVLN
jgi:hypothetical protein